MPADPDSFRNALRLFAAGVTLVTSARGDERQGMTATAFTSISAAPPLVAVAIHGDASITPLLDGSDARFAVNILAQDHVDLANRFAFEKKADRFLEGRWKRARTGAPVLADALAWLDCTVLGRHPAGSHSIYLGQVEESGTPRPDEAPLLYWNRDYRQLRLAAADQ